MNGLTAFGHLDAAGPALTVRGARVLVLGYGNPGRQDDGLGPAAAAEIERLDWPGVTVCDNYQLVIEDAIEIAEHDVVWFVDAARTGAEPYEVRALSPAFDVAFTSHLVKPEALLAIADRCCGKSPEAYLLGIRGYEFEFLEGLTDRASSNLAQAVALIRHRIGDLLEAPP
jgi:hydrogenase maturation protease